MRIFPLVLAPVVSLAVALTSGCSDPGPESDDDVPGCDPDVTAYTVWVADQAAGMVMVLDHAAGAPPDALDLVGQTLVGGAPHNIAFSPDRRFAYVTNLGASPEPGSVIVLDTSTYQVVAEVTAGVRAHGVALTPDGGEIWVANVGSSDVTIIDAATLEPAAQAMAAGDGAAMVAFLPDGSKAYISNGNEGTTSVVDVATRQVIGTMTTGQGAMGLVVSRDGGMVFETEGLDDRVSAIDTASDTVVNTLTFEGTLHEPHGIALAGDELIITNRTEQSLAFVDGQTLERIASAAVPGRPDLIGVSPDCRSAYLTLRDASAVAIVDLVERVEIGRKGLGEGDVHGIAVLRKAD